MPGSVSRKRFAQSERSTASQRLSRRPRACCATASHAQVDVEDVVEGDVVLLDAGDQVVADGTLRRSDGLALDESILTGESEPVPKDAGEDVRSGSFAVEGAGAYLVTAVGEKEPRCARRGRGTRVPASALTARAVDQPAPVRARRRARAARGRARLGALPAAHSIHDAVPTTVAAVVTLVPEGLILLTSVTFAVAGIRMARRGALAQQLNAIESLASVDTICLDKTGTLTDARLQVEALVPAAGVEEGELAHELGRYAASAQLAKRTLAAIDEHCAAPEEEPRSTVPFSSRRRWSALQFGYDDVRARRARVVSAG